MLKKLIKDESGLSTIEILVGMIVLVLLAIISFAALRGGVQSASTGLGDHVGNMVANSKGSGVPNASDDTNATLEWGTTTP